MAPQPSPTADIGYIRFQGPSIYRATENLQTEDTLFEMDEGEFGSGGCDISFDFLSNGIDWNLPSFDFFKTGTNFDHSTFDKSDQISLDIAMINEMLINAISDMGCCDIAQSYNDILIPFFSFFGGGGGAGGAVGAVGSLIDTLISFSEIISALRAITEPLDCLVKPLPGNPWKMHEVDPLAWSYGYWKEAKPVINFFMSGELLDIIGNPVHLLRTKLQACLTRNTDDLAFSTDDEVRIGTTSQLKKLADTASKTGTDIISVKLPKPKKPVKPRPEEYHNGDQDKDYIEALKAWEMADKKYPDDLKVWEEANKKIEKKAEEQQTMNRHLAVASKTKSLLKARTNGICDCIADALGINELSIRNLPLRKTQDFQKFVGRTISGVTNKEAGVESRSRPKDKPYTVKAEDLAKEKAKKAIANAGDSKGKHKELEDALNQKKIKNPYYELVKGNEEYFNFAAREIKEKTISGDQYKRVKNADKSDELKAKVKKENIDLANKMINVTEEMKEEFLKKAAEAQQVLAGENYAATSESDCDAKVAEMIYSQYLGNYQGFNFMSDPYDTRILSFYLPDEIFDELYNSECLATMVKQQEEKLIETLQSIDVKTLPRTTPIQNILNDLPRATYVKVDLRSETYIFNSGFSRRGGSPSWRNFNLLDLPWDDFSQEHGAIAPDKSSASWRAIFPNDDVGNSALLEYLNLNYFGDTLQQLSEKYVKGSLNLFWNGNDFEPDTLFNELSDSDQLVFIKAMADTRGFKKGKMWVRYRPVPPKENINVPDNNGMILFGIDSTDDVQAWLDPNSKIELDSLITSATIKASSSSKAKKMQKLNNEAIENRSKSYKEALEHDTKIQYNQKAIMDIDDALDGAIASVVPTDFEVNIPCECDGLMCSLLSFITQYLMELFQKLIDEIMNQIMKYLIPDWVKDLMKLVNDFMQCFASIFGIVSKMQDIMQGKNALNESLADRVQEYPSDPCFIPEGIIAATGVDDDDVYEDPDFIDDDDVYGPNEDSILTPVIVGYPNPTDDWPDGDPGNESELPQLPIVLTPGIETVEGIPGRNIAGCKYICDYLVI